MIRSDDAPTVVSVGENPTLLWGLSMGERTRRIARSADLPRDNWHARENGPVLLVNAAFAYDPCWLRELGRRPDTMLTLGGVPALAHVSDPVQAEKIRTAMLEGIDCEPLPLTILRYEDGPTVENKQLRKRETPFLIALNPQTVRPIERASYFGAYKGVTDVLTKYLWPEWALVITRIAARLNITPNMVTAVGAAFCLAATALFAFGHYWQGMAFGLVFMVLDTVDGKLARCTITSSWWGNVFDHGIDLIHPPFWWWFWATGLVYWGLALDPTTFWLTQIAIQGGYVVQRMIEGLFMRRHQMMHIHVWRRFDSWFRLITARRNPNMVILFVATLFGRPDIGIVAVAWWTVISLVVHCIQLLQAEIAVRRHGPIKSWLSGDAA